MNQFRKRMSRFFYNNSTKGIPNLMLIICVGTLLVSILNVIDRSQLVYSFIRFDRSLILQGQLWRLISYIFCPTSSGIWLFLLLFAYYSIGRMLEAVWGTLKFNLFYFLGVILMDLGALLLGTNASTYYLNLSLFLALATLYPDNKVLLMYIIPLKMKYLAWFYLGLTIYDLIIYHDFSAIIALLNYFIFFGRDCMNVLPGTEHVGAHQFVFTKNNRPNKNWASAYQKKSSEQRQKSTVIDAPLYRHKCTVCGKTDISHPNLDFRYCSKCSGFYCYCQDHISNHTHIT